MRDESNLTREDIAIKPREFKEHLDSMFGPGAKLIERSIAIQISERFKLKLRSSFDLVGAIDGARSTLSVVEVKSRPRP